MHRTKGRIGTLAKATLHTLAMVLGGAGAGATLGLIGAAAGLEGVAPVAWTALALAALDLLRFPVFQRDRETRKSWLDNDTEARWAVQNGATLGVALATRVGFWGWWVVPVGSFFAGSGLAGAALYSTYSAGRGLGTVLLMGASALFGSDHAARWIMLRKEIARRGIVVGLLLFSWAALS